MDTPRSSRTPSPSFPSPSESTSLWLSRENAAKDMANEIVELPLEEVFSNYLPPVPQTDIDECHSRLQQSGVIRNYRWSCFLKDPKDCLDEEEFVFKDLETLFQSVVEAKKSVCHSGNHSCSNTVCLVQTPSRTTICEVNGRACKIDFALEIIKSTVPEAIRNRTEFAGKIFNTDVAGNVEVNKNDNSSTRYDDAKKAVYGAVHCMGNDPCRRFTFSVTIENTQMRIWYYSRSHSVVSEPFNFVEDTRSFIRFVLAFAFASPAALGYDPTVRRCCDESGKIFYVFEIVEGETKHYFRTIRVLSDYRAAGIPGRGSRVFLVRRCSSFDEMEPTGDDSVLRDFWLDERALPEWTIQANIFNRLEELKKVTPYPEWLRSITNHEELMSLIITGDYKRFFMTILERGEVRLEDACDYARGPKSRNIKLPALLRDPSPPFPTMFSTADYLKRSWAQAPPERVFSGRKHYRLVYKEVCQTFAGIMQLNVAVTMLLHGLTALQLLYLARYVHRDVSAGNILCYKGEQGKLSDLEYAKPFRSTDEVKKDAKTGTPGFMSIEVQLWRYQFRLSRRILPSAVPFFHNFQHDLESLFWLFAWLVSYRTLETVLPFTTQQDLVYLRQQADLYFSLSSPNHAINRYSFILLAETSLAEGLSTVARRHGLMRFVVDQLYHAKQQVYNNYLQLEEGDLEDPESFSTIYNAFGTSTRRCPFQCSGLPVGAHPDLDDQAATDYSLPQPSSRLGSGLLHRNNLACTSRLRLSDSSESVCYVCRIASSAALRVLEKSAVNYSDDPVAFREDRFNIARTTLSLKVLVQDKDYFSNLVVDAVLRLRGFTNLEHIQVIKKVGGELTESYLG